MMKLASDRIFSVNPVFQIQSPFKTMVVLRGGVGLGVEMEAVVPKSFRGSVPDISSRGNHLGVSALGLWHWLPSSSVNGLEKQDKWPSFFSSLGAPPSDSKPEKRVRFLPQWLAGRASLWSKELSSSQWQVILPCSVHSVWLKQKYCCSVVLGANSLTRGSILRRTFEIVPLRIHFARVF